MGDALFERVDVVGGAEAGLTPGLLAERMGEPFFQLLDAGGLAGGAFLRGGQVCLQGSAADDGPDPGAITGVGFGGVELFEQVAVAGEEAAIDPGGAGRARPADLVAVRR